jgi:hypothetical protein
LGFPVFSLPDILPNLSILFMPNKFEELPSVIGLLSQFTGVYDKHAVCSVLYNARILNSVLTVSIIPRLFIYMFAFFIHRWSRLKTMA